MTAMPLLWTPVARASAEKSFGEAHWRFFIYGRLLLRALPLLLVAGAVVAVVVGVRALDAPGLPSLSAVWLLAPVAVGGVWLLVRRIRSPYRIPRRRLFSRY
jgi:hypothetical protein